MLLSAALIVRDEADHLAECLTTISEVVDEIVVVDTGSTDDTPSVAKSFGALLVREPWRDDFAYARNIALDHAHGEWILYIDADERLHHVGDLRSRLEESSPVALLVRFKVAAGYTRYWEHRVFRNRPDVRFRGPIHETMVPDIQRVAAREGATVAETQVEIDHLGYDGDHEHKHRRDLPLLLKAVEQDPARSYLWHRLGGAYAGVGEIAAAEAAWERGLEAARVREPPHDIEVLPYADLVFHSLDRGESCGALIDEMSIRFPDDPMTQWAQARESIAEESYRDALGPLEALARVDADAFVHPCLAYDVRLFGEIAYQALGAGWFHLGEPAEAASWFARAGAANRGEPEYDIKRQLCEVLSARERVVS